MFGTCLGHLHIALRLPRGVLGMSLCRPGTELEILHKAFYVTMLLSFFSRVKVE